MVLLYFVLECYQLILPLFIPLDLFIVKLMRTFQQVNHMPFNKISDEIAKRHKACWSLLENARALFILGYNYFLSLPKQMAESIVPKYEDKAC